MTEVDLRVPTADDLLRDVREGIEEIVRAALEAATNLHEEADETLERYDATTSELAALKVERHSLKHDLADLPPRVHVAALDGLAGGSVGENAEDLQNRYVAVRERLPVAEARIGKLEEELASIVSGGSRPSKVDPSGGARKLVKHTARDPILDNLNETVNALERLRNQLPDVVSEATADLVKERDTLRSGQNDLWGLAKRR